jgi:hypothetical protein
VDPAASHRPPLRSPALGLALLLAAGAATGGAAVEDGPSPATHWAVFAGDDAFRIRLPAPPEQKTNVHMTVLGPVVETDYTTTQEDSHYTVEHVQIPRLARFLVSSESLLAQAEESRLEDVGAQPLDSRELAHTGYDGRSVRYRIPGEPPTEGELRLFLVGKRLFMLDAGARNGTWSPSLAERFFSSFEPIVP